MTMTAYKKRLKAIEREVAALEQQDVLSPKETVKLEQLYVEYNQLCEQMEPVFA